MVTLDLIMEALARDGIMSTSFFSYAEATPEYETLVYLP
jgi:hypothetical protein